MNVLRYMLYHKKHKNDEMKGENVYERRFKNFSLNWKKVRGGGLKLVNI